MPSLPQRWIPAILIASLACARAVAGSSSGSPPQGDWRTWRGNDGLGIASATNLPLHWSEERNVRWKVPVPGVGSSSPIVVGDCVYLTTAIEAQAPATPDPTSAQTPAPTPTSATTPAPASTPASTPTPGSQPAPHDFAVLAFDRTTGAAAWRTIVHRAVPHEAGHRTGSLASPSPLSDGDRIYASFGSRGIYCLDLDGETLWSKQLGTLTTRKGFGEGASPALAGDALILNWDHEGPSFLIALDKRTGEELWRQPRDEATNWTTPVVAEVDDRLQVIVAGTSASRGYDAGTGEEIWSCTGLTLNAIPSPVYRDGVVYLMGGYQRGVIQALRLAGAKGDITDTAHRLWRYGQSTSYVPSPLIYGEFVYFLRQNHGVLTCLDAATGLPHYEAQRLPGMRHIYASPVGAQQRIYLFSREGTGLVLARGAEFEQLASNSLDDTFDGSPAIAGDALFLRGRAHLYCIAER